tara:strand:+ start:821 stop:4180 length:3360 start_codon:yes stop_codon:yes gene_type:complete
MQRYKVNVTDTESLEVEANSPDEARAKVKAIIAERTLAPQADNLFFNYDSGVKDAQLRFDLGLAENEVEREKILSKYVGNEYAVDSSGQLALTPEGMKMLGLGDQIRTITLKNGEQLEQNTVIDERTFGFNKYDLADFSGVVGPIFGSVIALVPQLRAAKALTNLLGGRSAMANMLLSGLGGATGKGLEEAYEINQGYQAQSRDELRNLLAYEGVLGFAGQGLGEGLFKFYSLLLGKQAPFDNLRFQQQAIKGRSILDVMKLDKSLGREATEKEIAKAVKEGKVGKNEFKALPSQSALNRVIPGRLQAVAETVLGNKRVLSTKAYLREEIDRLNRLINGENFAGEEFVKESTREQITGALSAARQKLNTAEIKTNKQVNKLVEELMEGITSADDFANALNRKEIGEVLIDSLSKSHKAVEDQLREKYINADKMLLAAGKDDPDLVEGISISLNKLISEHISKITQAYGRKYGRNPGELTIQAPKEIDDHSADEVTKFVTGLIDRQRRISSALEYENGFLQYWEDLPPTALNAKFPEIGRAQKAELKFGENLQRIRNDLSTLKGLRLNSLNVGRNTSLLDDIIKILDNPDDALVNPGLLNILENPNSLVKMINKKGRFKAYINKDLDKTASKDISDAVMELKATNKLARERLAPFDSLKIKQIIGDSQQGNYNINSVYDEFILSGSKDTKPFEDFFQAIKNHEKYLEEINTKKGVLDQAAFKKDMDKFGGEQYIKTQLQRKILHDAWRESYDKTSKSLDFKKFADEILKFDRTKEGKMEIIFGPSYKNIIDTVTQLRRITPSMYNKQPLELENLINQIVETDGGLRDTSTAQRFLDALKNKSNAAKERIAFEQNSIIKRLDVSGTDEIADVVFKPNSAANIQIVKETVDPETFVEIQQASLSKLLKDSFDPSKEKITDIFKPDRLRRTLDSYGDTTLEAMFGKESLLGFRALQSALDGLTIEKSAGTLVAAGIAVNALSIGMLPTVAGLAIMRQAFSNPAILKLLAKKDPGSVGRVIQFFIRSARQLGIRLVGDAIAEGSQQAEVGLQRGQEELQDIERQNQQEIKSFQDSLRDLRDESQRNIRNLQSSTPLPQVEPVNVDPLSPERLDFAERLANRPIV